MAYYFPPKGKPRIFGSFADRQYAVWKNAEKIYKIDPACMTLVMPLFWGVPTLDYSKRANHATYTGIQYKNKGLILSSHGNAGADTDVIKNDVDKIITHNRNSWSVIVRANLKEAKSHNHLFNQRCNHNGAGGVFFRRKLEESMLLGWRVPGGSSYGWEGTISPSVLKKEYTWSVVLDYPGKTTYISQNFLREIATDGSPRYSDTFNDGYCFGRCTDWSNYYGWDGSICFALAFDKVVLSKSQIDIFVDRPWDLYRPVSRPIYFLPSVGWTRKISGVTNPAKVCGISVGGISKVLGF